MNKFYKGMCLTLSAMMILSPVSTFALTKDETVYAKMNGTGTTKKVIVSEHLKNIEKNDTINDISTLKNIENVNGKETYTVDGNKVVWNANKNDIYYQGTSTEKLPISVKVTYQLNGKEIKENKLVGKKGHVTVTVQYTNNLVNIVNGQKLYTPFVVATEASLSTKTNSNVEVTSGKVISTGTTDIVAAISSPGLSESLNEASLSNLNTVKIDYDTKKFSKPTIYSVATSKVLESSDFNKLNDVNGIYNQVNELSNASNQIVEASKTLSDGTTKLTYGSKQLVAGSNNAYQASLQLKAAVDASIKQTESDKTAALSQEQIAGIAAVAKGTIDTEKVGDQAVAVIKESNEYKNFETKLAGIEAAYGVNRQTIATCTSTTDEATLAECSAKSAVMEQYKTLLSMEQLMESVAKNTAIATAQVTAEETAAGVAPKVANSVKQGAQEKTVASLKVLSENLGKLSEGLKTLNSGTNELNNGVAMLNAGSKKLYDGANLFNETGIKKVSDLVNNKLRLKIDTVKQLTKLSNNYSSFASKDNNTEGNTKFIMIIK